MSKRQKPKLELADARPPQIIYLNFSPVSRLMRAALTQTRHQRALYSQWESLAKKRSGPAHEVYTLNSKLYFEHGLMVSGMTFGVTKGRGGTELPVHTTSKELVRSPGRLATTCPYPRYPPGLLPCFHVSLEEFFPVLLQYFILGQFLPVPS